MTKTDLVTSLLQQENRTLTQPEKNLLEIMFFIRIYDELYEIFKSRYKDYEKLIKANRDKEERNMNGIKFMQEMIKDILLTEEYSLVGIATHTQIPEEVLSDVVTGMNPNPTFEVSRKIFELHIKVRRSLYDSVMRKLIADYLKTE